MIPGTHKETAAVALAAMGKMLNAGVAPHRAFEEARKVQRLAERRELVAAGALPGSSALPFPVALAVDLVGLVAADSGPPAYLYDPVERALEETTTGGTELWFDAAGNAFLSFEHEEDATLFRLALDA